MRACFLGQNICALGFGVATLQSPPLIMDEQTGRVLTVKADEPVIPDDENSKTVVQPPTNPKPL